MPPRKTVFQDDFDESMRELKVQVAGLEKWMNESNIELRVVKEGVANFREFQQDARDFFTQSRTRDIEREKQTNKRDQEIKDTLTSHQTMAENKDKRRTFLLTAFGIFLSAVTVFLAIMEFIRYSKGH
jgi:hypothetical protein